LCAKFLLRLDSKNKVLKPDRMFFFDLSRSSKTHENNLITLFLKYDHVSYFELSLLSWQSWERFGYLRFSIPTWPKKTAQA